IVVGDDRNLATWAQLLDALAERCYQPATDGDVVGTVAELDVDGDRLAGAERSWCGVPACAAVQSNAATQTVDDLFDDGFVRHIARFYRQIGFGIDRI